MSFIFMHNLIQSLQKDKKKTCSDEGPECWTSLKFDNLLELQASSIVRHVVSVPQIINQHLFKVKLLIERWNFSVLHEVPETFYLAVHL